MHLNYHFFKFLCPALEERLVDKQVSECFSQNKDELVICFQDDNLGVFYVVAHLIPAASCLYFPVDFKRSKRNNVTLFPELLGQRVVSVHLFTFERAFSVRFRSGGQLVFKMHGSRSNLLYFPPGAIMPATMFRKSLRDDALLELAGLEKPLVLDKTRFYQLQGNVAQFLPTLGKQPRNWLKARGYLDLDIDARFALIQELLDLLDSPLFAVFRLEEEYVLTLLPCPDAEFTTGDPIEVCNVYFKKAVIRLGFEQEKRQLVKSLRDHIVKTDNYLRKTYEKLAELESQTSPGQLADILMANLHQIPPGAEQVELFDFYKEKTILVPLKRGVSPQKQAETLYRKAKNRKIELSQLEKNLEEKEGLMEQLTKDLTEAECLENHRELRSFMKDRGLMPESRQTQEPIPFKRFSADGFEILVGKSSKANDEMLRRYAWKEDLWLHAKGVSGSHVLIKYRSGAMFPKPVIERAAALAAYYSKSRTDSLCPVIFTPVKYVRKVKGAAPGAVHVDREQVVMVRPEGPEGEK
ncbi:Fibronectin/fibrinogen-binding protein [Lunatimonas lonarensis]|uniref:Fibronectin/fibrinogen-binding protein n=1 Tax=Lunatimonas lonarensis TaxID=1232681 RepID=R7ZPM0_9BACT|nr:NFACT RNA binding domain-containing protein [Lunatimonas lonarensis]EON76066.1 Fibronectin/fibrinogen-binding protein [Lunatimonas lonarensis]